MLFRAALQTSGKTSPPFNGRIRFGPLGPVLIKLPTKFRPYSCSVIDQDPLKISKSFGGKLFKTLGGGEFINPEMEFNWTATSGSNHKRPSDQMAIWEGKMQIGETNRSGFVIGKNVIALLALSFGSFSLRKARSESFANSFSNV